METCSNFAVALASNVFWSNSHHWMSLPALLASVQSKSAEQRDVAMEHAAKLVKVVLLAEQHVSQQPAWTALMDDLGWHRQQFPREIMALLVQGQFNSRDQNLKRLSKRLCMGTATTKDNLEKTFAFLHRKASTHSTNFKMADSCKWLYSIVSPYAETGGCPQIASQHMFAVEKSMLPKPSILHRPKNIKESKWRNSGPLAQQRSAAAAAFLIHDLANAFRNVDLAWVGPSWGWESC